MTKLLSYFLSFILVMGLVSCEDELTLPDNVIAFESTQLGLTPDENEITVTINFSREASEEGALAVQAELTGIEYGSQFTTDPEMVDNAITLPVATGQSSVSFRVIKTEGSTLLGDEQVKFTLSSSIGDLVPAENNSLTLTFSEIIALQSTMDPNVGGEAQPNKVFVDLSGNRQFFISRDMWDLGFYAQGDDFRVILNSSSGMLAKALDKTDLNDVTAADTTGFGLQLSIEAIFGAIMGPPPSWVSEAAGWFDDSTGDLSKTAIAGISATEAENKVYIVNRGEKPDLTARGWKKIRVIRNGNGYTLQFADINATTFQTIEIEKDDAYAFNYVNFDSGLIEAEPKKDRWDIAFTVFTNSFPSNPMDPSSPIIPFAFNDFVIQNRYNVETAMVMTSSVSFEDFNETNLSGITFSTSQKAIGSSWRSIPSGPPPLPAPSVRSDRFYVVKDPAGNIYKLKFTALTQGGERGKPQIQFELVQEAN